MAVAITIKGIDMAILFGITCVFSILTEYAQVLIPGRAFNVVDMLFNLAGVLGGILITYFFFIPGCINYCVIRIKV